jgi:hypothetical protein
MTVFQERNGILHEKYFVIIRSSGVCAALSIHTAAPLLEREHHLQPTCVKHWNPRTVHLKSVFVLSLRMRPLLKFQNFPGTPICLSGHISPGFCRRGNPMEVIWRLYCLLSWHPSSHFTANRPEQFCFLVFTAKRIEQFSPKKPSLYSNSTHDKPAVYSTQLIVIRGGPASGTALACHRMCALFMRKLIFIEDK